MALFGRRRDTVDVADLGTFEEILRSDCPSKAATGKSVDLIRKASRTPNGRGVIGDICVSLVIPADPSQDAISDFHAMPPASDRWFQSYVADASGGPNGGVYMGGTIRADHAIVFPRVADAAPCTCGRGMKYRHCHKRRKASRRRRVGRSVLTVGPFRIPR